VTRGPAVADSGALRVRRHRLHRKGDHSLCRPGRCSEAGQVEASAPALADSPRRRVSTSAVRPMDESDHAVFEAAPSAGGRSWGWIW
jgi:hypothetical protein